MNGIGEFIWNNENKKYLGYFVNDKKNGFGIFSWQNPIKIFIGFWTNGIQNGVGKYIDLKKQKCGIWKGGKKVKGITSDEISDFIEPEYQAFLPFFNLSLEELKRFIEFEEN